ncbi:hypothetical protein MNBD_NITROSPINAE02-1582 [hydrothermal vent metagenome]|uniref:General secretion pathway GspH domain-containing protein n=1 Tax=hydrothermal vent metagenome TaxID=652676 RepID=A0A3B1BFZ4_9ZZZZ
MIIMKHRDRAGFTLVELLIVMALIGVLAGVAIPRLPDVTASRLKSQARRIAGTFTYLYQRAAATQVVLRLTLDMDSNEYYVSILNTDNRFEEIELPFAKRTKLPSQIKISETYTTRQGKAKKGNAMIHFFPGGQTELAVVHMTDNNKNEMTLITNPLTGKVNISAGYKDVSRKM